MSKETGGPAFPCDYEGSTRSDAFGMTLRDYFAAKAMQGMLCNGFAPAMTQPVDAVAHYDYARHAYAMADAMLEARQ